MRLLSYAALVLSVMVFTGCKEVMAYLDNPVNAYMEMDETDVTIQVGETITARQRPFLMCRLSTPPATSLLQQLTLLQVGLLPLMAVRPSSPPEWKPTNITMQMPSLTR